MLAFLKSENHRKKLYALPAIVLAFPTIPVFVLLPTFYAEEVGLGLAAVGLVLLGLRIIDVLSDPIIGWLTDLIPYKYGRRKLPIMIGGLISAPALLFLLTPSQDSGLMYLALSCGFLYIGWTAIQIPYLAWSSDLYSDFKDRNYINGLREGGKILGILAAGLLLFILLGTEGKSDFHQFTWITIGLGILCFLPTLFWVPEIKTIGSKPSFVFPKDNKLFLKVVMAWFVNGLANGLPAVCLPLFMTHILKVSDQYVYLLIFVYFLFAVLSIPLWLIYAHHRAKHRVWCASMLLACAAFLFVPFIGEHDVIAFGLVCAFTGMALGSDLAMPPSIQAD